MKMRVTSCIPTNYIDLILFFWKWTFGIEFNAIFLHSCFKKMEKPCDFWRHCEDMMTMEEKDQLQHISTHEKISTYTDITHGIGSTYHKLLFGIWKYYFNIYQNFSFSLKLISNLKKMNGILFKIVIFILVFNT